LETYRDKFLQGLQRERLLAAPRCHHSIHQELPERFSKRIIANVL
jgi:hypothetical protein